MKKTATFSFRVLLFDTKSELPQLVTLSSSPNTLIIPRILKDLSLKAICNLFSASRIPNRNDVSVSVFDFDHEARAFAASRPRDHLLRYSACAAR